MALSLVIAAVCVNSLSFYRMTPQNSDCDATALSPHGDSGPLLQLDKNTRLFATGIGDAVQGQDGTQYAVSADGQNFLINTIVEQVQSPITLILNWQPPRH